MKRSMFLIVSAGAVVACQKAAPGRDASPGAEHVVTAAMLDSLPRLSVVDGRLVCLADGQSPCPVDVASANWVHESRFATWEPRRQVQIWSPDSPNPQTLGEVGATDSQYQSVASVAASGAGFIVLDPIGQHAINYTGAGKFSGSRPIPPMGITNATGYAGDIPVLQVIRSPMPDSLAVFEIREIDSPGDTLGRSVLRVTLPWLRIRDNRPSGPLPLFPSLPVYSVARDSDIVWSAGDVFAVRRQSPSGVVRWTLTSNVPGPAIAEAEIDQVRKQLAGNPDPRVKSAFDSNLAHTGKYHAAIAGLLVAGDGKVLVASPQVATSDLVDLYVLDAKGAPAGRFVLPRRTAVLLFAGDSLLVQRPGANAQPELRWLRLSKP